MYVRNILERDVARSHVLAHMINWYSLTTLTKSSLALEPLGRPRSVDVSLFNGSRVCTHEKPCCFIMSKWKHVNNFWKYSDPEPLNNTNHILNCALTSTTLLPCSLVYFKPWFSLPRLSLLHWNIFPFASRPSYINCLKKGMLHVFLNRYYLGGQEVTGVSTRIASEFNLLITLKSLFL